MNRSTFALFVALLIHFLILLIFWILGTILPEPERKTQEEKIRVSLKELPRQTKATKKQKTFSEKQKKIEHPDIAPPMPKGSQLEKIVKKPPVKLQPKAIKKTPKLNPQPPKEKIKIAKKIKTTPPKKKEFIPLVKKEERKENTMDWLYQDMTKNEKKTQKVDPSMKTAMGRNIQELYGSEFGELSAAQQEYILDNQEIMRRITQQVLTRQAKVSDLRGLNVNTTNVIEFYLHPNGDMSDFRFLSKSGYFILDDITRMTIEYAYSKYPRPKEKTLIRYNVFYNLRTF